MAKVLSCMNEKSLNAFKSFVLKNANSDLTNVELIMKFINDNNIKIKSKETIKFYLNVLNSGTIGGNDV